MHIERVDFDHDIVSAFASPNIHASQRKTSKQHWKQYTDCCSFIVFENDSPAAIATMLYDKIESKKHGCPTAFIAELHTLQTLSDPNILIQELKRWASEHNASRILGPMTPFIGDERGVLIKGHEQGPCIGFPFSPAHYPSVYERTGFQKAMDMHAFRFTLEQSNWFTAIARYASMRCRNLRIEPIASMKKETALARVANIYNSAWNESWMFFPIQVPDLIHLYDSMISILIPELNFIVTVDGHDAAMFMSVPNVLDMDRENTRALSYRGMLFGVMPEFRKRGLDALMASVAFERANAHGYRLFDIGWILESNSNWLKQAAKFAGDTESRRIFRLYELSVPHKL